MTRRRRLVLAASLAALVALSLETLAFAGLWLVERLKPGSVVEFGMARHFRERVTDEVLERVRAQRYDRELGWVTRPLAARPGEENKAGVTWSAAYDARGARRDPVPRDAILAATYGDSFTHCNEVGDAETWQHHAAESLGAAVLNFGVGGYGTLQAVLRAERHLRRGWVAPITILAIYENNVGRVVMGFRPYRYRKSGTGLEFKPFLRSRGGVLEAFENPWRDPSLSRAALRDLAISLAADDYWAGSWIRARFPYTASAIRGLLDPPRDRGRTGLLWQTDEALEVMARAVERFLESVRGAGSVPVILFLPGHETLETARPPGYRRLAAWIRERRPAIPVVDVNEHPFDRRRYNIEPYRGHASVYGNREIARILAAALAPLAAVPVSAAAWSPLGPSPMPEQHSAHRAAGTPRRTPEPAAPR